MKNHALQCKIKNALDESRILILVSQVLLGFQLQVAFEPGFEKLAGFSLYGHAVSFCLTACAFAMLTTPASYHRLKEKGNMSEALHQVLSQAIKFGMVPFGVAMGINVYEISRLRFDAPAAAAASGVMMLTAFYFWYGIEWMAKRRREGLDSFKKLEAETMDTPLEDKIQNVLTETRMVLPGAQALAGFQFSVAFTSAFDALPPQAVAVHFISLAVLVLCIILLMTPAMYHRLVENGEDTERFHLFSSRILIVSMIALAVGISLDAFLIAYQVWKTVLSGVLTSLFVFLITLFFWFGTIHFTRFGRERTHASRERQNA